MTVTIEKSADFIGKTIKCLGLIWFFIGFALPMIGGTFHVLICEVTTLPNRWCSVDFHPWQDAFFWILPRAMLGLLPLGLLYLLLRFLED